ncbi:hypothetical protein ACFX2F_000092 [Malus domestica]
MYPILSIFLLLCPAICTAFVILAGCRTWARGDLSFELQDGEGEVQSLFKFVNVGRRVALEREVSTHEALHPPEKISPGFGLRCEAGDLGRREEREHAELDVLGEIGEGNGPTWIVSCEAGWWGAILDLWMEKERDAVMVAVLESLVEEELFHSSTVISADATLFTGVADVTEESEMASSASLFRKQGARKEGGLDVWLGRLAMIGFAVAIGVEVSTGKGLLENFGLTSPLPTAALGVTALVGVLTAVFIFQSGSEK